MLPNELEHYLHEHIPLSKAMAVSVVVANQDEVTDWSRFIRMLPRKGRARIGVASVLEYNGRVAGRFSGEFVALGGETQNG